MILDHLCRIEKWRKSHFDRLELWKELTRDEALYRALEAEIRRRSDWGPLVEAAGIWSNALSDPADDFVESMAKELFQFGVFDPDGPIPSPRQWEQLNYQVQEEMKRRLVHQAQTMLALVHCARLAALECARLAALKPGRFQYDYDQAELGVELDEFPAFYREKRDLIWAWVCTLLGTKFTKLLHRVTVDVALCDQSEDPDTAQSACPEGQVVQLVLEIVEPGRAVVSLHPALAMTTRLHDTFEGAIRRGWDAACKRIANEQLPSGFGRYSITTQTANCRNVPYRGAITGASAGGAAFLGWWHALNGAIPDPYLIVLTTVEEWNGNYRPGPVQGLESKVAAICRLNRHDTIVVADIYQARQVEKILGKEREKGNMTNGIRVVSLDEVRD